jgi:chromosome condensin MukBEF MukE localization factor
VTGYYSLLSRAVSELKNNTDQEREDLYQRARAALLRQLRNGDPPFSESQIEAERFALEEAITRVEAESRAAGAGIRNRVSEEVV